MKIVGPMGERAARGDGFRDKPGSGASRLIGASKYGMNQVKPTKTRHAPYRWLVLRMSNMLSNMARDDYRFLTQSIGLGGHVTSVRIEAMVCNVLEEIVARKDVSLGRFLSGNQRRGLDRRQGNARSSDADRPGAAMYYRKRDPDGQKLILEYLKVAKAGF